VGCLRGVGCLFSVLWFAVVAHVSFCFVRRCVLDLGVVYGSVGFLSVVLVLCHVWWGVCSYVWGDGYLMV